MITLYRANFDYDYDLHMMIVVLHIAIAEQRGNSYVLEEMTEGFGQTVYPIDSKKIFLSREDALINLRDQSQRVLERCNKGAEWEQRKIDIINRALEE